MSHKTEEDKKKTKWPWTARQKRRQVKPRETRKQIRHGR